MAKNNVSQWDPAAANNTDVGGVNIAEGCAPSGINNAIRTMMAQIKATIIGLSLSGSYANGKIPVITGSGSAALRDILGTVSMSGGVPTGALTEFGSNANGVYGRWANGFQVCVARPRSSVAEGHTNLVNGMYLSDVTDVTFPAAFSAIPSVAPMAGRSTGGLVPVTGMASTVSTTGFKLASATWISSASVAYVQSYIAAGQWS